MRTFNPSRENAAAVALLIFRGVVEVGDEAVLTRVHLIGCGDCIGEHGETAVWRSGEDLACDQTERGTGSGQGSKWTGGCGSEVAGTDNDGSEFAAHVGPVPRGVEKQGVGRSGNLERTSRKIIGGCDVVKAHRAQHVC